MRDPKKMNEPSFAAPTSAGTTPSAKREILPTSHQQLSSEVVSSKVEERAGLLAAQPSSAAAAGGLGMMVSRSATPLRNGNGQQRCHSPSPSAAHQHQQSTGRTATAKPPIFHHSSHSTSSLENSNSKGLGGYIGTTPANAANNNNGSTKGGNERGVVEGRMLTKGTSQMRRGLSYSTSSSTTASSPSSAMIRSQQQPAQPLTPLLSLSSSATRKDGAQKEKDKEGEVAVIDQQQQQQPGDKPPFNRTDSTLTEVDLEGGTLLDMEQREEVDPVDGCRVQISTYRVLSADGTEESTITKRRKLKVNCIQSVRRVEFCNGKESKWEERTTVIDNLADLASMRSGSSTAASCGGFGGSSFEGMGGGGDTAEGECARGGLKSTSDYGDPFDTATVAAMDGDVDPLLSSSAQDRAISEVLLRTQDNFLTLLKEKKEQLVQMFPELFSQLRTQPAVFEEIPASTVTETVVNEDGTTTTRTRSSKAFSSHFTREETFLNGVRQEARSRFRAFMEYAGPDGGFCIRLNEQRPDGEQTERDEEELSDSGGDIDSGIELLTTTTAATSNTTGTGSALVSLDSYEDGDVGEVASQISRGGTTLLSELHEDESASALMGALSLRMKSRRPTPFAARMRMITAGGNASEPDMSAAVAASKRAERAWHAVNELVESEDRYVAKLGLLERFREDVERSGLLDRRQCSQLFSNIASLHRFHNDHLLPQLMDRRREWHSTRRIGDVMRKQAPFLKLYSEYTNNYKRAMQLYDEMSRKKRHFEELARRYEQLPECEHLPLSSHFICPVQRVMRYQLLLREYQKHLVEKDADHADTATALALVVEAAGHANEIMRKLDRYRDVLEVQEQLGNSVSLVSPGRELLLRARVMKVSAPSSTSTVPSKADDRVLFVFNDLFLLASERSGGVGVGLLIGGGGGSHGLKPRALFHPAYTQIYEGDNLERDNSFYLRGSDSASGQLRCVELACHSLEEKRSLLDVIWTQMEEARTSPTMMGREGGELRMPAVSTAPSFRLGGSSSTVGISHLRTGSEPGQGSNKSGSSSSHCPGCDVEFTWFSWGRSQQCPSCSQRFCKACFVSGSASTSTPNVPAMTSTSSTTNSTTAAHVLSASKICFHCAKQRVSMSPLQHQQQQKPGASNFSGQSNGGSTNTHGVPTTRAGRPNLLATPASHAADTIKAGYIRFRGGATTNSSSNKGLIERYFVLRTNFCLYSYKKNEDAFATAMLPLAGCDIQQSHHERLTLALRHANRLYHLVCASESEHAEWMAALLLSANAKLPNEQSNDAIMISGSANNYMKQGGSGGNGGSADVAEGVVGSAEPGRVFFGGRGPVSKDNDAAEDDGTISSTSSSTNPLSPVSKKSRTKSAPSTNHDSVGGGDAPSHGEKAAQGSVKLRQPSSSTSTKTNGSGGGKSVTLPAAQAASDRGSRPQSKLAQLLQWNVSSGGGGVGGENRSGGAPASSVVFGRVGGGDHSEKVGKRPPTAYDGCRGIRRGGGEANEEIYLQKTHM